MIALVIIGAAVSLLSSVVALLSGFTLGQAAGIYLLAGMVSLTGGAILRSILCCAECRAKLAEILGLSANPTQNH